MIQLPCPHCGPRNASEFRYLGEEKHRPDPATTDPAEWRAYLYAKANPAGWTTETWLHALGCRAFFTAERHTVSNEIRSIRLPGASVRDSPQLVRRIASERPDPPSGGQA